MNWSQATSISIYNVHTHEVPNLPCTNTKIRAKRSLYTWQLDCFGMPAPRSVYCPAGTSIQLQPTTSVSTMNLMLYSRFVSKHSYVYKQTSRNGLSERDNRNSRSDKMCKHSTPVIPEYCRQSRFQECL